MASLYWPQKLTLMNPSTPLIDELPVPGMDPAAVRRWLAMPIQHSPWLHEEVGARMAQRLSWIKNLPDTWLDWEPVRGGVKAHHAVAALCKQSQAFVHAVHGVAAQKAVKNAQSNRGLLARLTKSAPALATEHQSVGMVWSNMFLHGTHHPQQLMQRWHSQLKTHGFLMFSCLGPDSLMELRQVYQACGWAPPGHSLTDMHDLGDMLVQRGFAEPVMDMERIRLTYPTVDRLLADLRELGRNLHSQRNGVTRGRRWRLTLSKALEGHLPRTDDGHLVLTFEVIYGHAHKPKPRVAVKGSSQVSLEDMRQMLGVSRDR